MAEEDYIKSPVPIEKRQKFFSILVVWLGFIVVVGTMAAGGGLTSKATLPTIINGIIIGNILLGVLAAFAGWVGAHSGMTFYQLGERVFGSKSMRVVGLYVPVILIGWFAIEAAILGGFIGKILELSDLAQRVLMFLSASVMAGTVYYGFRAIKNLSLVFLPIIFLVGLFAIFQTDLTGLEDRQNIVGESEGIFYVATIVVSTWVMGVLLNLPDVTRFAKSPWQGALVGFVGILIGNIFNLIIGVAAAINTGSYDPSDILVGLGIIPLAILLAVSNIWTTNDNNLYSATLGVSRSFNISRGEAVIMCGVLGAFIAFLNPATVGGIFTLLIAVGSSAPALGGVVLGAYVLSLHKHSDGILNPIYAWAGWIIGSILGIYIGGLVGIIAGFFAGWLIVIFGYYMMRKDEKNEVVR